MRNTVIRYGAVAGILAASFGTLGPVSAKASEIPSISLLAHDTASYQPAISDRALLPRHWCHGGGWDGGCYGGYNHHYGDNDHHYGGYDHHFGGYNHHYGNFDHHFGGYGHRWE